MDAFTRHGGRLATAQRAWPDAPKPWIDLSTGVNPRPYPAPRATLAARARLPDPEDVTALEALAARAFGVADPARVVAVAGAEAALRALPHLLDAATVAIAAPTYGGHAEAWAAAGRAALAWPADEAEAAAVVIVNPNNPDGRVVAAAELLALADRLASRGGRLVVDESFADVAPEASIAASGHPAIVILRSFGKAYGLPGLRLGFVVAEPALAQRLRTALGDWPLSADALAAGLAAYADHAWLDRARLRLGKDGERLDAALRKAGFREIGGTSLFRLVSAPDALACFHALCAQGLLTRPFADAPGRLRFGLPHPRQFPRVERALGALR